MGYCSYQRAEGKPVLVTAPDGKIFFGAFVGVGDTAFDLRQAVEVSEDFDPTKHDVKDYLPAKPLIFQKGTSGFSRIEVFDWDDIHDDRWCVAARS